MPLPWSACPSENETTVERFRECQVIVIITIIVNIISIIINLIMMLMSDVMMMVVVVVVTSAIERGTVSVR